jgi:hypothetical protein
VWRGSGSVTLDNGEDFEPVFAMLMTTREDILERVARIPIMAQDPGSGSATHDNGEDFAPVFAMLMTTREDILERVARIPIMTQDPGSRILIRNVTCVCHAHDNEGGYLGEGGEDPDHGVVHSQHVAQHRHHHQRRNRRKTLT